jgi:hypothetical protein
MIGGDDERRGESGDGVGPEDRGEGRGKRFLQHMRPELRQVPASRKPRRLRSLAFSDCKVEAVYFQVVMVAVIILRQYAVSTIYFIDSSCYSRRVEKPKSLWQRNFGSMVRCVVK